MPHLPDLANRDGVSRVNAAVAEVEIRGTIDVELRALQWLYLVWLPNSGYAPAHPPTFEAWNGRPFAHGMEHFELRIQLALADGRVPV